MREVIKRKKMGEMGILSRRRGEKRGFIIGESRYVIKRLARRLSAGDCQGLCVVVWSVRWADCMPTSLAAAAATAASSA